MIEVLKQYDLDSDGFITPEEFEFSVILSGGSMDDTGTASMKDMIEVFADEYGRVPIRKVAKFYKILDELNAAKEGSPEKLQALRKLLKSFDESGDGKLCQTEAKIGFGRINSWHGKMDRVFDQLKDGDGKVSIEGEQKIPSIT